VCCKLPERLRGAALARHVAEKLKLDLNGRRATLKISTRKH
jgi:hypothetical protein